MKFLLIAVNAKYIHSNPGLYSIRAYSDDYKEQIEIAEYTVNHLKSHILADIFKKKPDVAAFSCYIWNWSMIQEIIVELHKVLPKIPIWVGGPEVSYDAENVLENLPMLSGVMIGEGEETFNDLMRHYIKGSIAMEDIKGIATKKGMHAPRPLTDLSKMPFLYEDLHQFENRIIYYESSRGCPFRCSYCLSSIDKKVRLRNSSIVTRELQFFLNHNVTQVKFVDRTFNCNHKHAMQIWKYLKEHDNGITNFHFEISADIINQEEIKLLNSMRCGLVQLEIGVQTTNPHTLKAINRYVEFEQLQEVVRNIQSGNNIHTHLDLIAGLPFEDYESFAKSFNDVYRLKPEQLQLGFLKVLKGSRMHEKAEEYGIVYNSKPPYELLYSKWLPYEEVLRLKGIEEMVELYYNSNQFTATIPVLILNFRTPFAMFEALAEFYEQKGYFVNSPARTYRYHILLEFAVLVDTKRQALYHELLTYDMYLRENLKSRPDFARDMSVWKEKLLKFYQKEENTHQLLPEYKQYNARQMSKMTHMEAFSYPVWEEDATKIQRLLSQEQLVLFDYRVRNPLTYQARTVLVQ